MPEKLHSVKIARAYPPCHHEDMDGAVGERTVASSQKQQMLVVVVDIATRGHSVYREPMENTLYMEKRKIYTVRVVQMV